jgi:hypothetical protein
MEWQLITSQATVFIPAEWTYIAAVISLPVPIVIRKVIIITTSHAFDLMKYGTDILIAVR